MRCKTAFNACSVRWSPFAEGRFAVSTAQNFGIIGNGRQHVFDVTPGGIMEVAAFDTLDGLYDCAWSEENESILMAASGDGSIKVYDLGAPPQANPLRQFHEHKHECCSLSANMHKRDLFLSSSWDDTIKDDAAVMARCSQRQRAEHAHAVLGGTILMPKPVLDATLWSLAQPASLRTFPGHTYCVYQVVWNPSVFDVFLSASGDTTVRIWDLRHQGPTVTLPAHAFEVLSADWCKYNDCIIATGSVDKSIKIWDVRMTARELRTLLGHGYAVRRVQFSPHSEHILASCSYDMTVRLWDTASPGQPLMRTWEHHSEFAVGLDFSMLREGLLASAGWDESAWVWSQADPVAAP